MSQSRQEQYQMSNEKPQTKATYVTPMYYNHDSDIDKLCYEVFFAYEKGQELLLKLESIYLRLPIALPNEQHTHATFNQGMLNFLNKLRYGAQKYMAGESSKAKQKEVKRTTR